MSLVYHERPGVYSSYDASSVIGRGTTERVIALVGTGGGEGGTLPAAFVFGGKGGVRRSERARAHGEDRLSERRGHGAGKPCGGGRAGGLSGGVCADFRGEGGKLLRGGEQP